MDGIGTQTRSQAKKQTSADDIESKSLRSHRSSLSRASSAASSVRRDAVIELATSKTAEQYADMAVHKQQELESRKNALCEQKRLVAEQAAEQQRKLTEQIAEQQRQAAEQQHQLELAMEAEEKAHEMEISKLSASKATAMATAKLRAIEQCIQEENEEENVGERPLENDDRTSDWVSNQSKFSNERRQDGSEVHSVLTKLSGSLLSERSSRRQHTESFHTVASLTEQNVHLSTTRQSCTRNEDPIYRVNRVPRTQMRSGSPSSVGNPSRVADDIRIRTTSTRNTPSIADRSTKQNAPSRRAIPRTSHGIDRTQTQIDESHGVHKADSFLTEQLSASLARQNLPKIQPDVFTGDHTLYYPWKKTFQAMLSDAKVNSTQELIYLRSFTAKEPQKLVDSFRRRLYDDPNAALEDTWASLDKQFGNTASIAHAYLRQIEKAAKFAESDNVKLMDFSNICADVESQISSLPGLRCLDYANVLEPILDKVPKFIRTKWEKIVVQFAHSHANNYPGFDKFADLIAEIAEMKNHPNIQLGKSSRSQRECDIPERGHYVDSSLEDLRVFSTNSKPTKMEEGKKCIWHGRTGHDISECYDFTNAPMHDKTDFVMAKGLCFKCLKIGHIAKDCQASVKCNKCGSVHHRAEFHEDQAELTRNTENVPKLTSNVRTTCTSICDGKEGGFSCSKTLLVDVYSVDDPSKSKRIYAVIDEQSNASMIRSELIEELGLTGSTEEYLLSTCSTEKETRCGRRIGGLKVKSIYGKEETLPTLLECDNIPSDDSGIATPEIALKFRHLKEIAYSIPSKDYNAQVMLLIGRDAPEILKVRAFRNGPRGAPWAHKLSLGWTISGQACLNRLDKAFHVVANKTSIDTPSKSRDNCTADCPNLLNISNTVKLNDIFEARPDDNDLAMSQEDRKFLQIMDTEFHINSLGNCEMPLPLRDVDTLPTDNKNQAARRLKNLQQSFKRKPAMMTDYVEFMSKIFERGHAEVIHESDPSVGKWYLPHFGVYHDKKPNQIRVVFDSSAESNGISLNKILMSGPDQMNSLVGVLFRFRREDIGILCDIEQMFHTFHVNEGHRDYLRFLWFRDNNPSDEIVECRMKVHLFGNNSSPAIATYGLRRVADMSKETFGADVQDFIHSNFYVDDGLTSLPTESEATALVKNTQAALRTCNLRLHKIASNSVAVMNALPDEDRNTKIRELDLTTDHLPSLRSLGVYWNLEEDTFTFSVTLPEKPYTRRGVLAIVNSVFDPLGFAAPVTMKGKKMLQALMMSNKDKGTSGWDDDLPPEKRKQWEDWRNDLPNLQKVSTPRCYHPKDFGEVVCRELHAFSDASQDALGVVVYLKQVNGKGEVAVSLVYGQSKVTPARAVTIPRLELCAAVLSSEAVGKVRKEFHEKIDNVYFYTDSKIVLGYIQNETRRFYVYVANRVQTIHELSSPDQWRYVETKENPADIASRGIRASQIMESMWFTGPHFLQSTTAYPAIENTALLDDDPDVRKLITVHDTLVESRQGLGTARFQRFSTWTSARRAVATVRKMLKRNLNQNATDNSTAGSTTKTVSAIELKAAEIIIIKEAQRESFSPEIKALERGKPVSEECKSSHIANLTPFLDDDHILRVGGRCRHADMTYEEKHPILLPRDHYITSLILAHYHERVKHQGRVFTLGAVRVAGYWIDNAQKMINDLIRSCTLCRRLRGQPMKQKMADLPEERVNTSPPFTHIGVDVFGPWVIHTRKMRGGVAESKRWGLVITCLSSRAVHIEVIEKMDASSFVMALRRFFAVRGTSTLIRCDRGTNFVGAKRELEEALSELDHDSIMKTLRDDGCEWIFNPPCASHYGGVWERQILTIRRILDAMLLNLGRGALTHEILVTFMAEVSGIINARPISAIYSDTDDPQPLTPAMLLTMKARPFTPVPGVYDAQDAYAKRRWRQVQLMANQFWNRWKTEYIHNLQMRLKWEKVERNLKEDDVVIVIDAGMPQYQWPLARVIEATESRDGLVRKATVALIQDGVKKVLSRPISKLILLLSSDAEK